VLFGRGGINGWLQMLDRNKPELDRKAGDD
jgi:hypothetical protein